MIVPCCLPWGDRTCSLLFSVRKYISESSKPSCLIVLKIRWILNGVYFRIDWNEQ